MINIRMYSCIVKYSPKPKVKPSTVFVKNMFDDHRDLTGC